MGTVRRAQLVQALQAEPPSLAPGQQVSTLARGQEGMGSQEGFREWPADHLWFERGSPGGGLAQAPITLPPSAAVPPGHLG